MTHDREQAISAIAAQFRELTLDRIATEDIHTLRRTQRRLDALRAQIEADFTPEEQQRIYETAYGGMVV